MIVVSPSSRAKPVMVTRRQPSAFISRAMASTSSCGANIHRPSQRSSTCAEPGIAASLAMRSTRGITASFCSMSASPRQEGVVNMPDGLLAPALRAKFPLRGFGAGQLRAVHLFQSRLGNWNDRAAAARTRLVPDFMHDPESRLVAGDGRQLAAVGDRVRRAELHAQPAERALAGEEVPGDPSFVLLVERDRFGCADGGTSLAARAQADILLDQPAERRRGRRHVGGVPRPRAATKIPPDNTENPHLLLLQPMTAATIAAPAANPPQTQ